MRVDHQSFESIPEESLLAIFSHNDCFASRVSNTTVLRIVLNVCQSCFLNSIFLPFCIFFFVFEYAAFEEWIQGTFTADSHYCIV